MNRHVLSLSILFAAFALQPERQAQATATAVVVDQKVCKGTAAASGGTMTCDYATTLDRATRLVAHVGLTNFAASHLANAGFVTCEYVVENKNGTVTAVPTFGSTINPANENTATFVAAHAQGSDTAFSNSGGGTFPQCRWSISTTNARVTVTNNSVTSITADVTVWIQAFNFGSQ
jgi:hypothetical protein